MPELRVLRCPRPRNPECPEPAGQAGRNGFAFLQSCYKAALRGKRGGGGKLLPKYFSYFEKKIKTRLQDPLVLIIYPFSSAQLAGVTWVLINCHT